MFNKQYWNLRDEVPLKPKWNATPPVKASFWDGDAYWEHFTVGRYAPIRPVPKENRKVQQSSRFSKTGNLNDKAPHKQKWNATPLVKASFSDADAYHREPFTVGWSASIHPVPKENSKVQRSSRFSNSGSVDTWPRSYTYSLRTVESVRTSRIGRETTPVPRFLNRLDSETVTAPKCYKCPLPANVTIKRHIVKMVIPPSVRVVPAFTIQAGMKNTTTTPLNPALPESLCLDEDTEDLDRYTHKLD